MDEILIYDAVERMLRGEMSPQEKQYLDDMRKNNPDIDQLVVEHSFFLQNLDEHGKLKEFKHSIHETEAKLIEEGFMQPKPLSGKAKVVSIWKKYRKVVAVAASIAGIVSVVTVAVSSMYSKAVGPDLVKLGQQVETLQKDNKEIKKGLSDVKNDVKNKIEPGITIKSGGTGFLIDGKGYIVTNAHVVKAKSVVVTDHRGYQFKAKICMSDETRDIAILRIEDVDYEKNRILPYSLSKSVNLASSVYTLGYPKDEVVYGEGYLSSITGYKGDTLSYQISISADHGNSGGPVVNKSGEIIGVLTDKNDGTGSVFAIKSQYIFNAVNNLKLNPEFKDIKLPASNSIRKLSREDQVKRINECVFLVKSY